MDFNLVFGVEARVDDPIHVEIEVVELYAVRVRARGVGGDSDAIDDLGSFLDHLHDGEGVAVDEPTVECGDPHCFFLDSSGFSSDIVDSFLGF